MKLGLSTTNCLGVCKLLPPLVEQLALIDIINVALPVYTTMPYVLLLALWCFDLRWLHTTKIIMVWGPSLHMYGIEDYICYAHNYYILSISASSQGMWQRVGIMILSQSRGTDLYLSTFVAIFHDYYYLALYNAINSVYGKV